MPDDIHFLSTNDVTFLKDTVKRLRERRIIDVDNQPDIIDSPHIDANATSAIYVARVPVGGLPALVATTELSTYTGTGIDPIGDLEIFQQDGVACQLYQLSNVNGIIIPVPGLTQDVYNLSGENIPYNTWVLIKQDRYGTWWVDAILSNGSDTGTGTSTGTDGTGTSSPEEVCDLLKIGSLDCIKATITNSSGVSNEAILEYTFNKHWESLGDVEVEGLIGYIDFYFIDGEFVLEFDSKRMVQISDNCWKGTWLTGHFDDETGTGFEECSAEYFTICLCCTCCSIDGWDGPGFYCIEYNDLIGGTSTSVGTGTSDCFAAELFERDRCDDNIRICSGPYVDEDAAIDACDPLSGCASSAGLTLSTYWSLSSEIPGTTRWFKFDRASGFPPSSITGFSYSGSAVSAHLYYAATANCDAPTAITPVTASGCTSLPVYSLASRYIYVRFDIITTPEVFASFICGTIIDTGC